MLAPVVLAGREARRDASGDPEIAQHQRHRTGEVLAVAATRLRDEGSERRDAGDLGRPLVVLEGSGAEPALELERGGIRIRGLADDPPRRPVDGLVGGREAPEDERHLPLAVGSAEWRRGDARLHLEIDSPDLLGVAGR